MDSFLNDHRIRREDLIEGVEVQVGSAKRLRLREPLLAERDVIVADCFLILLLVLLLLPIGGRGCNVRSLRRRA